MEERIISTALRARKLPRQMLLIAPSPFLEVHTTPGGTASSTSPTISRTTEPVWKSFSHVHTVSNVCGPIRIAFVVKDASSNDVVIGSVVLSVDAAQIEGWYPLGNSGAELYLRVTRTTYCHGRWSDCARAPLSVPMDQVQDPANGELRSVSSEVGFLFRNGELIVSLEAVDVPVSAKELQVVLKTDDQSLRGGETPESLQAWKERLRTESEGSNASTEDVENDFQQRPKGDTANGKSEIADDGTKRRFRLPGNLINDRTSAAAAAVYEKTGALLSDKVASEHNGTSAPAHRLQNLVSVAGSYALGLRHNRIDGTSAAYEIEAEFVQKGSESSDGTDREQKAKSGLAGGGCEHSQETKGGRTAEQIEAEESEPTESNSSIQVLQAGGVGEMQAAVTSPSDRGDDEDEDENEDEREHDSEQDAKETADETLADALPKESVAQVLKRHVDFGSFRFALMYEAAPRMMHVQLIDNAAPFAAPLGLYQEHHIRIPNLADFECSCSKSCKTHFFRIRLNGLGPGRVTLLLRIQYRCWPPLTVARDVTNRFLEVFSSTDKLPESIHNNHPRAAGLTYLFVGGLFTQHYPTYFERNIRYLKEKLQFCHVEEVPIHTEGCVERNAKDIRDAIMKTERSPKSVVLIGHSKGGIDAVAVVKMFPEVIPFLFGVVAFQAPFGGTFLVDFVSRSKLAVNTIFGAIEKLWKGDETSFVDMGYPARLRALGILKETNKKESSEPGGIDSSALMDQQFTKTPFATSPNKDMLNFDEKCLAHLRDVPVVAFASRASFDILKIRDAAKAAGVATMAPAAQVITQHTGYSNDGLVVSHDARIPYADNVLLDNMMHTEPALYVKGTKYPPGQLTASGLLLLFEKAARSS